MREVTAKNEVAAKVGDEVKFSLPDMIDVFTMYKHILFPLVIAFAGYLLARALLAGLLQSFSSLLGNVVLLVIAAIIYVVAAGLLTKLGIVKKGDGQYNITITAITKPSEKIIL
ncbi:MAG: hypothetical protein CSA13_02350 [Clostridiales bacterium]|nr:MAG: hypothetical protein CSA13_02350 [Clostridiales bacterium]